MNRVILVIVALLLAVGAYYQFSYLPAHRADEAAKDAAAAPPATTPPEDAAKSTTDAASSAVDASKDAAASAADATEDAATAATDAATEAATAAGQAASDAAAAAGQAATGAADTAAMVWDATKLSGQDVLDRINSASIPQATKDTLLAAYQQVKDNPVAVQNILNQLKQAMGL